MIVAYSWLTRCGGQWLLCIHQLYHKLTVAYDSITDVITDVDNYYTIYYTVVESTSAVRDAWSTLCYQNTCIAWIKFALISLEHLAVISGIISCNELPGIGYFLVPGIRSLTSIPTVNPCLHSLIM